MKPEFTNRASALTCLQKVDIFLGQLLLMQQEFSMRQADIDDPEWIKAKLQHMFDIDQFYIKGRDEARYDENMADFGTATHDAWKKLNHQNVEALKLIIDRHGWPVISRFGKDADLRAWLIVQHADDDVEFQRSCLRLLERLYPIGETAKDNYAYLYDRVQATPENPANRQLQRFGTQGDIVNGKWQPYPIEDIANVDRRRAAFGIFIPRLKDYADFMMLRTDEQRDAFMKTIQTSQPQP